MSDTPAIPIRTQQEDNEETLRKMAEGSGGTLERTALGQLVLVHKVVPR